MCHTPHELTEKFPNKIEKMRDLTQADAHFAKLVDEYHDVNRTMHRAETGVTLMNNFAQTSLRKERARLKDEFWHYLAD